MAASSVPVGKASFPRAVCREHESADGRRDPECGIRSPAGQVGCYLCSRCSVKLGSTAALRHCASEKMKLSEDPLLTMSSQEGQDRVATNAARIGSDRLFNNRR